MRKSIRSHDGEAGPRSSMRAAPGDPQKARSIRCCFVYQVVRRAVEPFVSSRGPRRKPRRDEAVTALRARSARQRTRLVMCAPCEDGPGDPRQLVGQRAGHNVRVASRRECFDPQTQGVGARVGMLHHRSRTLHEQAPKVAVAAFTDAEQGGLAARAVLAWDQSMVSPVVAIYGQPGGCNVVGFETREACANLSGVMMGRLVPAPR